VWHSFLRRIVKGGFKRKNAPKNKNDTSIPVDEVDWSVKLSNVRIREITKTTGINHLCQKQHQKYIAHITRLDNDNLQKQLLFCHPSSRWGKLSMLTGVDDSQLRRTCLIGKNFSNYFLMSSEIVGTPDENLVFQ